MPSQYIVHARIPEGADPSTLIASFGNMFKVSDSKARALISKLPGKVSKPVTEREARRLAKRFERIGLLVDIVDSDPGEVVASLAASASATPSSSVEQPPVEQSVGQLGGFGSSAPDPARGHYTPLATSEALQPTANTASADNIALVPRDIPALQHRPLPANKSVSDAATREAKKEAATQALAASISQTVVVEDPAKAGLDPERDPPPLPKHVVANQPETNTRAQPTKPFSLRRKFALTAGIAGLLVVLTNVIVSTVLVPRILQQEQRAKTEGIATTLATSIAALIARPLDDPASRNVLQQWLEQTQPFLAADDVAMIVVTDSSAQVLAGWRDARLSSSTDALAANTSPNTLTDSNLSAPLQALIADEVTRASGLFAQQQTTLRLGDRLLSPFRLPADGVTLRTSAHMIVQTSEQGPNPVGTVVVGTFAQTAGRATRRLLVWLIALSLLPLVLGIASALVLARRMQRNVALLVEQASNLETRTTPVTLSSGDELEHLATSLEHVRTRVQPSSSTSTGESTQVF